MTETEKKLLAAMATLLVELVKKDWRPHHATQPIGAAINRVESLAAELFDPPPRRG